MSKKAEGRITSASGTRFTAKFVLPESGMQVNFLGNLSFSIQPFNCAIATLVYSYDSVGQLGAMCQFDGQLGVNNVKRLTLANRPVITGVLDMPISLPGNVSGSGVWAIN